MKIINRLTELSVRFPKQVGLLYVLVLLVALYFSQSITLRTSNFDLIASDNEEVKRFLTFSEHFGTPNSLILVFSGVEATRLSAEIDTLLPKLKAISGVSRIIARVPTGAPNKFQYFHSRDESQFYIFIQPKSLKTDLNEIGPLADAVHAVIKANLSADVRVGFTGIPQYGLDDQRVIQKDLSSLSGISLLLVSLIFILGFSSFFHPVLATGTLTVSVLLTLGLVALYPGHLTLLSASFASIIFGLGIDSGIHLVSDVQVLGSEVTDFKQRVIQAFARTVPSLVTASLTTAGAFFMLCFSGFHGFQELGIVAGVGILICLFTMLTLLPALLVIFGRTQRSKLVYQSRISHLLIHLSHPLLAGTVVAASLLCVFVNSPRFNGNYLDLQPSNAEAVKLEKAMVEQSDYSPYFAAFTVSSKEALMTLVARLKKIESVNAVRSVLDFPSVDPKYLDDEAKDILGLFQSVTGEFAVYAYPRGNIWESEIEQKFIKDMRAIDAEVTGMPFLGSMMVKKTKEALLKTSALAGLLLIALLALDFRNPILVVLITLIPLSSILWMHFGMSMLGFDYNPINVMAVPIVLGIAEDYAVHISHRFIHHHGDIDRAMQESGRSVLFNALTTLVGFGVLYGAHHRGLQSFGALLCLGIGSAFLLSVTFLPWALKRFEKFVLVPSPAT